MVYDWRHYIAVVQRKPGALLNGPSFAEIPPIYRCARKMLDIPIPGPEHDGQIVLTAVEP